LRLCYNLGSRYGMVFGILNSVCGVEDACFRTEGLARRHGGFRLLAFFLNIIMAQLAGPKRNRAVRLARRSESSSNPLSKKQRRRRELAEDIK